MLTPQRDPEAEKLLGAPATSRRDFTQAETLAWLAEIYDNTPAQQPRRIQVAARLVDEAGREVFASRDVLANGEGGAAKWRMFGYTGRIPLKNIGAGRYLLRVEADGQFAETLITVATD